MTKEQFSRQFPNAQPQLTGTISTHGIGRVITLYDNGYYERTWWDAHSDRRMSDAPMSEHLKNELAKCATS
jgi:hypothetical protein